MDSYLAESIDLAAVYSDITTSDEPTCAKIVCNITKHHQKYITKIFYSPHCPGLPGINHLKRSSEYVVAFLDTEDRERLLYQQSVVIVVLLLRPACLEEYDQFNTFKNFLSRWKDLESPVYNIYQALLSSAKPAR